MYRIRKEVDIRRDTMDFQDFDAKRLNELLIYNYVHCREISRNCLWIFVVYNGYELYHLFRKRQDNKHYILSRFVL